MTRARQLIGGEWVTGDAGALEVVDKFTGDTIGTVECASEAQAAAAVAAARRSFRAHSLDAQQRYQLLARVATRLEARRDEFAALITAESGLPITDATNEVTRTAQTLLVSAEEGKRLAGEMVPIEAAPGQSNRMAYTIRVPRGVVCGITAFNSPLNMVVHKVAPALAAGNTVVMKPPEVAPLSATAFAELLIEAGLPPGHLNLVHGPGATLGPWLAANPEIDFYTFTGSTRVGRWLRSNVGLRPVALELGSVAATIVCEDANLDRAAARSVASGFRRAGQMCTSTQRLFVQESILEAFTEKLLASVRALRVGDPRDPKTDVGPMISAAEAARAEGWVKEAVAAGARVLTGGCREGALLHPTVLIGVAAGDKVVCEEIFAPVLSIVPFTNLDSAIDAANATPFGLAVGLFTNDLTRALGATRRLHFGVVHLNESSSSRVDLIPFGGVKQSGLGREGPKYAMQEMTEERLVTISL
jgi:succinate-semialdehyde dehydrogenase/glutarate-semialdehyde dehydrogenase